MFVKTVIASLILSTFAIERYCDRSNTVQFTSVIEDYPTRVRCKVRVTFWTPETCSWGWKKSTGGYLTARYSAAVDPKLIPYGTKITLPGFQNVLIAEDTGSAVKKKTASFWTAKNLLNQNKISVNEFKTLSTVPVIDVCVTTTAEVNQLKRDYPEYVEVTLTPPYAKNITTKEVVSSKNSRGIPQIAEYRL